MICSNRRYLIWKYLEKNYSIQVDSVVEILELDAVKDMMESTRERDGNNKILEYLQTNHNVIQI